MAIPLTKPGLLRVPKRGTFKAAPMSGAMIYITPPVVDYLPQMLPSSNQGSLPKCAAYAMAGWLEWYRWKLGIYEQVDPNPIYAEAKRIDGNNEDGTYLESVLQAAQNLGWIPHGAVKNIREVIEPGEVRQALHRYGPILAAYDITTAWGEARPDGTIPDNGLSFGLHAVDLVFYDAKWFGNQNSWGESHGMKGFNRLTQKQFEEQFQYGLIWETSV